MESWNIKPGLRHSMTMPVTAAVTVPQLFNEATEFSAFPAVLATGYMVAAMELTCVQALHPHLPDGWGSLGVSIDVTHEAATPPGLTLTIAATLAAIDGRRATFEVEASDGVDLIGRGRHERAIVDLAKFEQRLSKKQPGA